MTPKKSRYITLEELRDMVLEGTDFCVLAAKTNDDITAQTLLHVLLSEEMFGEPFFSGTKLAQFDYVYARPDERANVGIF